MITECTLQKIYYMILLGYRHSFGKDWSRFTKINNNGVYPKENLKIAYIAKARSSKGNRICAKLGKT